MATPDDLMAYHAAPEEVPIHVSPRIHTISPVVALGGPMALNEPPPPSPTGSLHSQLEIEVIHALDAAKFGIHHIKTIVISGDGGLRCRKIFLDREGRLRRGAG